MSLDMSNDSAAESLNRTPQNTYNDPWSRDIAHQCTEFGRYLGTVVIADAAKRAGASVTWHGRRLALAELDGRRMLVAGPACTESVLSEAISRDKLLTKELLAEAGVRTPAGRLVDSAEDTVVAQHELGKAVVVKPRYGVMGRGVTVNIREEQDLRDAYNRAHGSSRDVLVEEYIEGPEYRGHGSPNECVALFQRLLPSVTGNGHNTVAELVATKNDIRQLNPNTMSHPIKLDDVADGFLARQGLSQRSILPKGRVVTVRDVNGITSGGDSQECLDDAPEPVRIATSAAVAAIPGMAWGGSDIIVCSETAEAFVMEINTYAAISGPAFPVYGKARDIGAEVWRRITEYNTKSSEKHNNVPLIKARSVDIREVSGASGAVSFTEIVQRLLVSKGFTIEALSRSIYKASRGAELLWFAGCLTGADLTRPHRVLGSQVSLRHILDGEGVPQVPGRKISNVTDLISFVRARDEMILMIPSSGRFDDPNVRLLPAQARGSKQAMAGRGSWFLQEYPAGRRLTVIASRSRALAVVARRFSEQVSEAEIQRVADRAIDAVGAVPELRWCAVELVVPQIGSDGDPLIEGMTAHPHFSPGDYLVAGDLGDCANLILEGATKTV